MEEAKLSAEGIEETFSKTARAFGSLMFNTPIVIEEGFAHICSRSIVPEFTPFIRPLRHKTSKDKIITVNYLEPDGGSIKTNRMFGTSRFGFISIKSRDHDERLKGIVFPYITAPKSFLEQANSDAILESNARLSTWANHDWFHNITVSMINPHITMFNGADIVWPFKNDIYTLRRTCLTKKLWNQGHIRLWDLEAWSMRQQKEVLTSMMEEQDNPFSDEVSTFIQAFKDSGLANETEKMTDPKISPRDFVVKLFAGNLVRAASRDHPLVQSARQACADLFAEASGDDGKRANELLDEIYKGQWAKNILFGNGPKRHWIRRIIAPNFDSAARYGERVKSISAHTINLARTDADRRLHVEQQLSKRLLNST